MRLRRTALATERIERRLAAILAADVAGYSRLMGADEEDTHKRGSPASPRSARN
jgi:class 3 adenylate cyclase